MRRVKKIGSDVGGKIKGWNINEFIRGYKETCSKYDLSVMAKGGGKMKSILIVIVGIAVFFSSISYAEKNFISNGGFEKWKGGLPVSWEKGLETKITRDSENKYEGNYSVRIQTSECKYSKQLGQHSIPIKGNTPYIFSGKVKIAQGDLFFEIVGYPSKSLIAKVYIRKDKPVGSGFVSFEYKFKALDTDNKIRLDIRNFRPEPGISVFNIDDLRLEETITESDLEVRFIQNLKKTLSFVPSNGHNSPADFKLKKWFDWDINNAWSKDSETRKKILERKG